MHVPLNRDDEEKSADRVHCAKLRIDKNEVVKSDEGAFL